MGLGYAVEQPTTQLEKKASPGPPGDAFFSVFMRPPTKAEPASRNGDPSGR
jgi:hypothetical protein